MEFLKSWAEWDPLGQLVDGTWKAIKELARHTWFVVFVFLLLGAVAFLGISGVLGDVYRSLFEFYPGRQWTYVMRDNRWYFLIPALGLLIFVFTVLKRERWLTIASLLAIFMAGFLGGHVFWGTSGPGFSWCHTPRFEVSVQPHNRLVIPDSGLDSAIVFQVLITPREDQRRSDFEVDIEELRSSIAASSGEVVVEEYWTRDDPFIRTVIISSDQSLDGEFNGQIEVNDTSANAGDSETLSCQLRAPYEIGVADS